MQIFRKLGWFFKEEKWAYFWGVLALFLVAIVQLAPPKVIGIIIDAIDERTLSMSGIMMWIGLLVAAAILQYLFRYIWRQCIWGSAAKLEKSLRKQLFHHFTMMDHQFFQTYRTGDLMAHATNDLNAVQNVAGSGILTLADSIITGGSTIIAMIVFVDWRLTLIALIPLPFLAMLARVLGTKLHDAFRESQEAFSDINDKTQESITGIKVIKTFGQEAEDLADFDAKIDNAILKNRRTNFLDALFDPFTTLIIGLSYVLTIILGSQLIVHNELTVGQLVSFISYIGMLVWPMFAIGRLFNVLERGSASYDRVQELLREKSHIVEAKVPVTTPACGTLDYQLADFIYPDDASVGLKNVRFTLHEGETIGIVGKTGAGKTTLIKLLMREYDEYQGKILWNDVNIKDYALDSLLPQIGYVPQDHFLFSMTVADNIRFARPEATMEEVMTAAKLADVHEDILGFAHGYETMVGERGVSLSGGQKQRLSIARALLMNPELLILDDALSAVDAKTEEEILHNLKERRGNKGTIIAAHRLSSVMHAKEILVIKDGTVAERGTHQELLALNGWYAKMYAKQQLEQKIEGGKA
ncbi:ABC transporter ATP-binding protein [Enterococcus nangangensis]|uniref:ABC transporter ATP-binding protein n=1 Tax=Enterococcus nangangensis TaxID=2559926 RepID=UPI0010F959B9|nr:ABC transporter transmembrane domain-containing protein [Enterococcus nangangensis]